MKNFFFLLQFSLQNNFLWSNVFPNFRNFIYYIGFESIAIIYNLNNDFYELRTRKGEDKNVKNETKVEKI